MARKGSASAEWSVECAQQYLDHTATEGKTSGQSLHRHQSTFS